MTFTGSVTTAGGSGNQNSQNENPGKESPDDWKAGGDVRKDKSSGKHPNYYAHHTVSGHNFIMDDSKGAESVTLQHRSGTSIQMKPDGQMLITSHNGKYEITFGEDRMTISGARDITVKGDASMRVYGDYNVTCHKNYNLTVMGDLNITAKNKNQLIRGNKDTIAKNETKKFEGSSSVTAGGGIARVAKGSITVASQAAKAHIAGAAGLHASVTQKGDMTFDHQGQGNMHMNVNEGFFDSQFSDGTDKVSMVAKQGKLSMKSAKAMNMKSEQSSIKMEAQQDIGATSSSGGIQMEAQSGNIQVKATSGNLQMKAGGDASVEGSTTHVSGSTVHVKGSSTTNIDGPSGLNLNGGLSQLFSGQLNFDFGQIMSAVGMPNISNIQAEMSQEEPDADSWTNGLL